MWRLYADAGQVADLRGILDDCEKGRPKPPREEKHDSPTCAVRALLRVQALADKKDVAALVALCQGKDPEGNGGPSGERMGYFFRRATAEALAGLGGSAVQAIKAALANRSEGTGWLIYALGQSSAPAALDVLTGLAERDSDGDSTYTENIVYALALKGEPGKKILKRLAAQNSILGKRARQALESKPEPDLTAPTWPRPKAGSLPKVLPGSL
jgi:hypothetical protein